VSKRARERRIAAQRRRRLIAGAGGAVIVGLLIAIVVSLVNAAGGSREGTTASPANVAAPAGATAKGALVAGRPDASVTVEVYLDYMCPFCGRFERANSAELQRLVADGTARLELYPLSFLDRMSEGTRYSTRAANAVATVADRAPDRLLAFHAALFAHQPGEGTPGLLDSDLAALARAAGVPAGVVDLFARSLFEPWIAASTAAAFDGGITGTPTVKINGRVFKGDLYSAGPFGAAVTAARSR